MQFDEMGNGPIRREIIRKPEKDHDQKRTDQKRLQADRQQCKLVKKLKAEGYEEVRLIDTTDGTFMGKKEASWLGLAGSTLLVGKK